MTSGITKHRGGTRCRYFLRQLQYEFETQQNQDRIIDVRVTDSDAPSYRTRNPYSVIGSQEAEKKKKYLRSCLEQRRTFVPFVVSVDGHREGG